jgi:hypothetical protein
MSPLAIALIVIGAVACCALCGYGIASAMRRSRTRRSEAEQPLPQR